MNIDVNAAKWRKAAREFLTMQGLKRGLRVGGVHIKSKVNVRPPHTPRKQVHLFGKKQRGAFFAKLRAGEIEVPYRRNFSPNSEQSSKRWSIQSSHSGFRQTVGNTASYSALLQGKKQALYHKQTGWRRIDVIAREETPQVGRLVANEIKREFK